MLKPIVFFLALTGSASAANYPCSCYCPTSSNYVGTAASTTCSSAACATACYNSLSACTSRAYSYGTCTGGSSGTSWDLSTYTDALGTGAIVAAAVGSIAGIGLCIAITVIIIILCKRKKRAQTWALQPHQQQPMMMQPNYAGAQQQPMMMQPNYVGAQQHQQWTPAVQPYPPAAPTFYSQSQYPPPYSAVRPINIQS